MQVYVDSEVGLLRAVLLASAEHFQLHEPINKAQEYYFSTDPPRLDLLIEQQARFFELLANRGVAIYMATPQPDSPEQLDVRDVATVINDTLIVCAMKEPVRQREPEALDALLTEVESPVVRVDAGVVEGGDIILDGDTLYVGLSERTNTSGLKWLENRFGDRFQVTAIQLNPPFLHLDVVFNLVGNNMALIYPGAIQETSLDMLRKRYRWITVTAQEDFDLATNVFSLSPETVISHKQHSRVNGLLKEQGLEVIEVDYSEIRKIGGAFRCGTCPLIRDPLTR